MVLPGIYAILSPITVGFLIGPRCLTGLLGGAIASGMMLALMMVRTLLLKSVKQLRGR